MRRVFVCCRDVACRPHFLIHPNVHCALYIVHSYSQRIKGTVIAYIL